MPTLTQTSLVLLQPLIIETPKEALPQPLIKRRAKPTTYNQHKQLFITIGYTRISMRYAAPKACKPPKSSTEQLLGMI